MPACRHPGGLGGGNSVFVLCAAAESSCSPGTATLWPSAMRLSAHARPPLPQGPAAAAALLPPEPLADLLVAVAHLGLDTDARLLQADLEAAAPLLLAAFAPGAWDAALPALAECVAGLGATPLAKLKVGSGVCSAPACACAPAV